MHRHFKSLAYGACLIVLTVALWLSGAATCRAQQVEATMYGAALLKLDCTVPFDGEVALRLSRLPERATLDGQPVAIQEDAERRLYVVKMAQGEAPHFLRKLELAYLQAGPRLTLEPRNPWIAGEPRAVRVHVENPAPATLVGDLDLVAGSFYRAENPPVVSQNSGRLGNQ